jgi:superfamily I DNA and/or RNA helicase
VQLIKSSPNKEEGQECFEYLKRIAHEIGLKVKLDNGEELNILSHNYSKIKFITPDSILRAFLCGKLPEDASTKHNTSEKVFEPVYPFGFNASQKDAVDKALANQLCIIEGPPGTGKTQTILNIIANAVMLDKSVAVVSSNNSATMNVLEKLQKYDVDFIAAYLGNSENKKEFINSQKPLPDISDWRLKPEISDALRQSLKQLYSLLREKLTQKNELAALKQELSAIETEQKHFQQYSEQISTLSNPSVTQTVETSRRALEMWLLSETYEETARMKGLIAFIKRIIEQRGFIGQKRKDYNLLKQYPREDIITVFQQQFYELRTDELTNRSIILTNELNTFDFDTKIREYSEISMKLFRNKLAEKFEVHKRGQYDLDDLWSNSTNFIKDYPVILSTTYSLRSSLSRHGLYDYVIIDESSQVDLCTGALALSCARKAVVVGDLKQLPNVVDSNTAAITDEIFAEFVLPDTYRYKKHSLLSAVTEIFPNAPKTLLREHYRCHPKIIEFCNRKFYDNQLIILTTPKSDREPLIVYKTTEGNHERNRVNQRQIDVIKAEIISQQNLDVKNGNVGIVTPYRNQTNALQTAFVDTNIKADTVDKFQGQEKDIIILSTVDNEITPFADNANRLNVAVSRAIEQLIVVVNDVDTLIDTNIGDLVHYIEYNNCTTVKSTVYSVFDYLYKSYAKRRQEYLKNQKRISEYDSENLMYALIASVLKDERFTRFDIATHVPLKMIIRNMDKLAPPEKQYVENILTHVDFLIFDAIGKSPRIVVEVDGTAVHSEGTRQAERDVMKNDILKKYELPIMRFRTDGSNERERLITALCNIVNST